MRPTIAGGEQQPRHTLSEEEILASLEAGIPRRLVEGRRVLVLTPDATRTCPLAFMVRAVSRIVSPWAARLDFMVALGTHQPMSDAAIDALYGIGPGDREAAFGDARFLNHRWDLEGTLRRLGRIDASRVEEVTGGLFRESVDVDINRAVFEYDLLLILGPVFPHEVAGFSGGHKYLFPGISGGDFLHFFHWLGAVHTVWKTIGTRDNPVRAILEDAAAMVPVDRHCIAMVVHPDGGLAGLFVGEPREAWARAAALSARVHVVYRDKPFPTVLGLAPRMYDELWTAAKVMYKLEPVVADGGKLIIHAPHVMEISRTWGDQIRPGRLPRAGLLPLPHGHLRGHPARRAGALHARPWRGNIRRRHREAADRGRPRDGHPRAGLPGRSTSGTWIPRPSTRLPGRAGSRRVCSWCRTRGRSSTGWRAKGRAAGRDCP